MDRSGTGEIPVLQRRSAPVGRSRSPPSPRSAKQKDAGDPRLSIRHRLSQPARQNQHHHRYSHTQRWHGKTAARYCSILSLSLPPFYFPPFPPFLPFPLVLSISLPPIPTKAPSTIIVPFYLSQQLKLNLSSPPPHKKRPQLNQFKLFCFISLSLDASLRVVDQLELVEFNWWKQTTSVITLIIILSQL